MASAAPPSCLKEGAPDRLGRMKCGLTGSGESHGVAAKRHWGPQRSEEPKVKAEMLSPFDRDGGQRSAPLLLPKEGRGGEYHGVAREAAFVPDAYRKALNGGPRSAPLLLPKEGRGGEYHGVAAKRHLYRNEVKVQKRSGFRAGALAQARTYPSHVRSSSVGSVPAEGKGGGGSAPPPKR